MLMARRLNTDQLDWRGDPYPFHFRGYEVRLEGGPGSYPVYIVDTLDDMKAAANQLIEDAASKEDGFNIIVRTV
jgi:hypothetical protein